MIPKVSHLINLYLQLKKIKIIGKAQCNEGIAANTLAFKLYIPSNKCVPKYLSNSINLPGFPGISRFSVKPYLSTYQGGAAG
jgi:hypothetical protein